MSSIAGGGAIANPDAVADRGANRIQKLVDRGSQLITYDIDPRDPRNQRDARYLENLQDEGR